MYIRTQRERKSDNNTKKLVLSIWLHTYIHIYIHIYIHKYIYFTHLHETVRGFIAQSYIANFACLNEILQRQQLLFEADGVGPLQPLIVGTLTEQRHVPSRSVVEGIDVY